MSRPSTSRLGQESILRGRLRPGVTSASLAIQPTSSLGHQTFWQTRRDQPSILRGNLRPGLTSASLSIQPTGRSGHFPFLQSRRGQPSLLRRNLRPGTASASLSITPVGTSFFRTRSYSPTQQAHTFSQFSSGQS